MADKGGRYGGGQGGSKQGGQKTGGSGAGKTGSGQSGSGSGQQGKGGGSQSGGGRVSNGRTWSTRKVGRSRLNSLSARMGGYVRSYQSARLKSVIELRAAVVPHFQPILRNTIDSALIPIHQPSGMGLTPYCCRANIKRTLDC
jgi:hypothetical protein